MGKQNSFSSYFKGLFAGKGLDPAIRTNVPEPKSQLAVGGYEAAAYTRDRSYIYNTTPEEAVNPTKYARTEVIRLSRYLVNNFALMERILTVVETYSIGPGLIAQASTEDTAFNQANTTLFNSWATTQFSSNNNQLNLYEASKLMARELVICGEFFLVLVKAQTGFPQFMLVKSEDVRGTGDPTDDSTDGLYLNDYGVVIAYNIFTGKTFIKVDASNVIHVFKHKAIGQLRGVGMFAASLNNIRDVKDLEVLLKRAVKTQAALAVHVKKKSGESEQGLLGNILPSIPPTLAPANGAATNAGLEKVFGGAVVTTDTDEDIELLSSQHPTENVLAYIEQLMRNICLNLSISYEFLVNVEALTGTGVRFVINDAANLFASIQDLIINGVLNRLYGYVTASFINLKKVSIAPDVNPYGVKWTRPLSITIDPTKVSGAEIALLQNSLTTFAAYYEARGKDWKHSLRQHALEEKYLDELSVELGVSVARLRALPAGSPVLEKEATLEVQQEDEEAKPAPLKKAA